MKIEFLIATMNRSNTLFLHTMFQYIGLENINAVVINQIPEAKKIPFISSPHKGIRIFSIHQKGLSNSRNSALSYSQGDIAIIADDDVVYKQDTLDILTYYHLKYPYEEVLTFQVFGLGKKYSVIPYIHNQRTILRVSSCEITLKKNIIKKGFLFDSRFGLGAIYPIGEENIWLHDIIRSGIKMRFVPRVIVTHDNIPSTGTQYSIVTEKARGAFFVHSYKLLAIPLIFWFAIKKYHAFKKYHSFITEIYYLYKGGFTFFLSVLYVRKK